MPVENKQYSGGWKSPKLRSSRPFGQSATARPRPVNPIFEPKGDREVRRQHYKGPATIETVAGPVVIPDGREAWFVVTKQGGLVLARCEQCPKWSSVKLCAGHEEAEDDQATEGEASQAEEVVAPRQRRSPVPPGDGKVA